jgi:hypothetical protein
MASTFTNTCTSSKIDIISEAEYTAILLAQFSTMANALISSPLIAAARKRVEDALNGQDIDTSTRAEMLINFEMKIALDLSQMAMQIGSSIQKENYGLQALQADINNKKQQECQLKAETDYSVAKTTVMNASRLDNLLIRATEIEANFIGTVGAGGLTPATAEFDQFKEMKKTLIASAMQVTQTSSITTNTVDFAKISAGTSALTKAI